MATYLSRYVAIANALVDGVATNGAMSAVADAFLAELDDVEIAAAFPLSNPPATRANLTNEQRAAIVVVALRQHVEHKWRRYDIALEEAKGRATSIAKPAPM